MNGGQRVLAGRQLGCAGVIGYLAGTSKRAVQYHRLVCAVITCGATRVSDDRALLSQTLVAGGALSVGVVYSHARTYVFRRMLTHAHPLTHAYMIAMLPCHA